MGSAVPASLGHCLLDKTKHAGKNLELMKTIKKDTSQRKCTRQFCFAVTCSLGPTEWRLLLELLSSYSPAMAPPIPHPPSPAIRGRDLSRRTSPPARLRGGCQAHLSHRQE